MTKVNKQARRNDREKQDNEAKTETVYRRGMTPQQYKAALIKDFAKNRREMLEGREQIDTETISKWFKRD